MSDATLTKPLLKQACDHAQITPAELTLKYEHGSAIRYYGFNQMRDAWLAGYVAAYKELPDELRKS